MDVIVDPYSVVVVFCACVSVAPRRVVGTAGPNWEYSVTCSFLLEWQTSDLPSEHRDVQVETVCPQLFRRLERSALVC